MAAMEGQEIEPALKRQRLEEVVYTFNTSRTFCKPYIDMSVHEMARELQFTDAYVIHKGVELGLFDKIPVTSEADPLRFLTEVGKFF
jgi:hypothetical protein